MFAYRAKKENLELPRIHLAINNRVIQYALRCALLRSLLCWNCLSILHSVLFHFPTHSFSLRSSKANRAMGDSVVGALFKAFERRPEIFTKTDYDTIQVQLAQSSLFKNWWSLFLCHFWTKNLIWQLFWHLEWRRRGCITSGCLKNLLIVILLKFNNDIIMVQF